MSSGILTIDDVASKNTPAIVDYLKEKGIAPVMFAEGKKTEEHYEEAIYALQAGVIIGNHSYSHPAFSALSLEQGIEEIEKCEAVLNRLYRDAGVERVYRPFRFPYGDKGGENAAKLQEYLREKGFHKLADTQITYPWWRQNGNDRNVDTFWTFDFEEYRLQSDADFTIDDIWRKMHNPAPKYGEALFGEGNHHIILLHAHDETEALVPEYYKLFMEHALENGLTFEKPAFTVVE